MKSGTTVSSYFKLTAKPNAQSVIDLGGYLRLGQVNRVLPIDSEENTSAGKFVQYEVFVQDDKFGKVPYVCRKAALLSGTNNFEETILEGNDIAFTADSGILG
jgi:hypothetical protein